MVTILKFKVENKPVRMTVERVAVVGEGAYERGYEAGYSVGETDGYTKGQVDGIEQGKQAEYDRFWDAFQKNGERKVYDQAFSANLGNWDDETYNPKYDILCEGSDSFRETFNQCKITNTKVPIRCKNTRFVYTFYNCYSLKTIQLLTLEGITQISYPFINCSALESITISGEIPLSISFSDSPLLTDASVQSILDALKDLTGATAQTLTFHADVGAKLTDTQKATITAKNWTLVY